MHLVKKLQELEELQLLKNKASLTLQRREFGNTYKNKLNKINTSLKPSFGGQGS
jgi:hypothetical protein